MPDTAQASASMKRSLRALLTGVIDYAGLFPPSSLPLERSIRNYAAYRQSDDHWMLGRFICPAARLSELEPYVRELFPKCDPLPLSVLGRGGSEPPNFLANLKKDLESLEHLQA